MKRTIAERHISTLGIEKSRKMDKKMDKMNVQVDHKQDGVNDQGLSLLFVSSTHPLADCPAMSFVFVCE